MLHAENSFPDVQENLNRISNLLFEAGSELASPGGNRNLIGIDEVDINYLENAIDVFTQELPELKNFILPGGSVAASIAHFARTVCRRCERLCVALADLEPVNPIILSI